MDHLPELQSDADVDALMARLRARIDAGPPTRPVAAAPPAPAVAALADDLHTLLVAQEAFASTVVRAMTLVVETIEEEAADRTGRAQRSRTRARTRSRRR
jgi:hypothetical protein